MLQKYVDDVSPNGGNSLLVSRKSKSRKLSLNSNSNPARISKNLIGYQAIDFILSQDDTIRREIHGLSYKVVSVDKPRQHLPSLVSLYKTRANQRDLKELKSVRT